ncbi:MAG: DegT/DnrJ/EryC1/StrS family aminotransferase [Candidatus Kerfeldbacteria bacterium]|nr:DegT/DnrJ/EryC1/StrS family aminotransferase [Candidatus Kerfeldbacteria bacterium]
MIKLIIPEVSLKAVARDYEKIFKSGMLTQGPYVKLFEKKVARMIGVRYAFATTSATTALHLSLAALGIGPGDEVLVADFTFPATANVVVQLGAKPVLVDVRTDDFTIDIHDLKSKITRRTKAIMPVDTFGYPANMPAIINVAKRHKLHVIEDAACSIGARIAGRYCGSFPTMGCFSFHPRKSITTGEGGMLTTNDSTLAKTISVLRNHGGVFNESRGYYDYVEAGFNYRMSEIQAALGLSQFAQIKTIIKNRRHVAAIYNKAFAHHPYITPPTEQKGRLHTYQSYVVKLHPDIPRDALMKKMRNRGIEVTLGTYSLHMQPFFRKKYGYRPGALPNSQAAFEHAMTLPLHARMTQAQLSSVIKTLNKTIEEYV